jgi:leader peptidase (prepilin peptidase)/N-methyltransferase
MTILWMILFFAVGAMVGSFINVVTDRLPAGKSIISPASHCFGCQRPIAVRDNMPIVSYLWLRGRCRNCGAHIPQRLLWVEIGTAILFAFIYWYYRFSWELPLALLFCSIFIALLLIDLEHSILPNIIVYPSMGIALVLAGLGSVFGFEPSYIVNFGFPLWIINAVVGGVIGFVLLLVPALLYPLIGRVEGMGWGDVKLAALIGFVTGFPLVILAIFLAVITGGIVAGILLLLKVKGRKDAIPFGPFLAVAAMATLFWGSNLINWLFLL